MPDAITQFQNEMQSSGFTPPEIIPDGKPHRFDIDKRGDHKGFYILFTDGVPCGRYGSWSEQEPGAWLKWSAKSEDKMTESEREENKKRWKAAQIARRKELAHAHRTAAIESNRVWNSSTPASDDNAYLKAKGVKAYGIKKDGADLIIPVFVGDKITSIQRIQPDGVKLFQSGGEISGGYYSIAGADAGTGRIVIVEGYATGATIREATGCRVFVALNAGNLNKVAPAIRTKFPDAKIIIAGDNDESQTGETKGKATADAVGGKFIRPQFADDESGSDWNDWCTIHGHAAVADAFKNIPESEQVEKPAYSCPSGYTCSENGVAIDDSDKEPEILTHKPVWVSALSRDGACENWGRLVHWVDHDGHEHERALPASMFHANGNDLAQDLASNGLPIVPGKERRLLQYLAAFTTKARLTAAPATGWHGEAFVLPNQTINEPADTRIIYQSPEYRTTDCIKASGTLEAWQTVMRDVSPMVMFAVAVSLAAPLRYPTATAAGGFHFYGRTSHGKTTLLQAAASVWGNATDPAMAGGEDAYLQRWNATKNGLEGMAASFNDMPLVIDEIGEGEERDAGKIIYQLMSGTGKTRANRTGGISKRRAWRITLLSNGELPVSDFIPDAKGGQLVRLIDIEATDLFTGRLDADAMKRGCSKYYGHAGPAFIESGNLLEEWPDFTAEMIGDAPTPEAGRVRDRFLLVAYAGELAIRRGILPWNQGDVLDSCKTIYRDWKESDVAVSDADRGIANVRAFLMTYGGSRFELEKGDRVPNERAGWHRNDRYHFTDTSFKLACGGVLPDVVRKALRDARLLHQTSTDKLKSQIRVDGKRVYVTSVKSDILTGDKKSPEPQETPEIGQGAQGFPLSPVKNIERRHRRQLGNAVTSATSQETEPVTGESVINKGVSPVSPMSPVNNTKLDYSGDVGRVRISI